ncbi:small ribosomal subunit protein uS13c-like isoform X2 [Rhododendron vialii]|uniref:small ribosomal subunit protein uS13c-like isoform X2 n=1 Tax=Rhododendron vialii TaxID=182163 RepID=UPI00265E894F|nr:small ribosomal subunit protein uS13c-like isoform X2 [Rhododendron vialii]
MLKLAMSRLSVPRGFINPSLSLMSNAATTTSFNSLSSPTSSPPRIPMYLGLSIRGMRMGGKEIPDKKLVEYSLKYIHGIGHTTARQILRDLNMENKITKYLSKHEIISLRDAVSKYLIDCQLRLSNGLAIKRLKEIQWYRWKRHIQGLPGRGQRTH